MGRSSGGAGRAGGESAGSVDRQIAAKMAEIDRLRKQDRSFQNLQNEGYGDGYLPNESKIEKLYNEIQDLDWNKERTAERREKWNARVRSGEFTDKKTGKVDMKKLTQAQNEQGWSFSTLKEYIKKHGL